MSIDLEASARAAAVETRAAIARAERAEAEKATISFNLIAELDAMRVRAETAERGLLALRPTLPGDAVMVPSQTKVIAKLISNQEDADEVIACLRVGRCHGIKLSECSTCQRYENAVKLVQRLAGLGAP